MIEFFKENNIEPNSLDIENEQINIYDELRIFIERVILKNNKNIE